ncbi:MAG: UDP-N-acetylmuramyl-tripeptide synthetase [Candidatus Pacebacteria bacterium]|nr:UDP-N-acetylmuramyl-tripeptide synthetase [Candidatus Paceibacterota bacterium]MBP9843099.1 UDP-N-acetylmuramyl-tripeptide synthetase [Candidatus Paceibacterota bacterium]
MDNVLHHIKKFLPTSVFHFFQPHYHFALAWWGAVKYKHPSQKITVIAITGTKGKSTTTELIAQILRGSGKKVASLSTIQFVIGDHAERNMFKMTTPGRLFVQKFLREAVDAGCTHAVLEMSSEGARQFRHKFIDFDALVFTNLSPEHIESHGSFEKYKTAKLSIAQALVDSPKRPRVIVANVDDPHGDDFLNFKIEKPIPYGLANLSLHTLHKDSVSLVLDGVTVRVPIVGLFNVYNTLAALKVAQAFGVSVETASEALRTMKPIAGRVEQFESSKDASKQVTAVVDYAHTVDSLEQLYRAFPDRPKVCVLGNTGGGRDTWKRPEMAAVAEKYCDHIILTNEDPYDENPEKIINEMVRGLSNTEKLTVIMDRKEAIRKALELAPEGGYVLVSGKGTDPYIMEAHGKKTPWSDAEVVKELLAELK